MSSPFFEAWYEGGWVAALVVLFGTMAMFGVIGLVWGLITGKPVLKTALNFALRCLDGL